MVSIAIDGPSGAGKSTMAKLLADKLHYIYVDTGALYRAIGLYCVDNGIDTQDREGVISALGAIDIEIKYVDGAQRVFLNGLDVTADIRRQEMSMAASNVSAIDKVRDFLFDLQRGFAKKHNVVMDGRDIGTVVLPDADVKIYLTATPQERTMRRKLEYEAKGMQVDFDQLLEEINRRDANDMSREVAPLKQAQDAVLVDSTGIDMDATLSIFLDIIKEKIK